MSKPHLNAPASWTSRLFVSRFSGIHSMIPNWSKCCFVMALCGILHPLKPAVTQEASGGSTQTASRQSRFQPPPTSTAEDRSSRGTAITKGDLTFDDIKFDIEKGGKFQRDMLTKEIEGLHKKTIRIRGYILPASVFTQSGIEEFVLVRDNMECCFGPGAALYDCVIVQMEKGKTADFTTRPVAVRGKFEIQEFKYPGTDEHYAIYKLTATEVK